MNKELQQYNIKGKKRLRLRWEKNIYNYRKILCVDISTERGVQWRAGVNTLTSFSFLFGTPKFRADCSKELYIFTLNCINPPAAL